MKSNLILQCFAEFHGGGETVSAIADSVYAALKPIAAVRTGQAWYPSGRLGYLLVRV
ncbi:MAG: hypothetical protein AAFO87_05985 [Cyanobacteria bacterium J06607_6]